MRRSEINSLKASELPTELTKGDLPYVPDPEMPDEFDIDVIYAERRGRDADVIGRSMDAKSTVHYEDGEIVFVYYSPTSTSPEGIDELVSKIRGLGKYEVLWVRNG